MQRSRSERSIHRVGLNKTASLTRLKGVYSRDLGANRTITTGAVSQLWGLPKDVVIPSGLGFNLSQELVSCADDIFLNLPDDCRMLKAYQKGVVLDEDKYVRHVTAAAGGHAGRALTCLKNLIHCFQKYYSLLELCDAISHEVISLNQQLGKMKEEYEYIEHKKSLMPKAFFDTNTSRNVQKKILDETYFDSVAQKKEPIVHRNIVDEVTEIIKNAEKHGICKHHEKWVDFVSNKPTSNIITTSNNNNCNPYNHTNRRKVKTILEPILQPPFYPTKESLDNFMTEQIKKDELKVRELVHGVSDRIYDLDSPIKNMKYHTKTLHPKKEIMDFDDLMMDNNNDEKDNNKNDNIKIFYNENKDNDKKQYWDSTKPARLKAERKKQLLLKDGQKKDNNHRTMQTSFSVPILQKTRIKASKNRFEKLASRKRPQIGQRASQISENNDGNRQSSSSNNNTNDTYKIIETVQLLLPTISKHILENTLIPPIQINFTNNERNTLLYENGSSLIGQKTARASMQNLMITEKSSTMHLFPLSPPTVTPSPPIIIPEEGSPVYAFRSKPDMLEDTRTALFKADWYVLKPKLSSLLGSRHLSYKDDKFKQIIWSFYVLLYQSFIAISSRSNNIDNIDSMEFIKLFSSSRLFSTDKLSHPLTVNRTEIAFDEMCNHMHPGDGVVRLEGETIPNNFTINRVEFIELLIRLSLIRCEEKKFSKFDEPEKLHYFIERCFLLNLPVYVLQFHSDITKPSTQELFAEHAEKVHSVFVKYSKESTGDKRFMDIELFEKLLTDAKLISHKLLFTRQNAINIFYMSIENVEKPELSYSSFLEFLARTASYRATTRKKAKQKDDDSNEKKGSFSKQLIKLCVGLEKLL